MLISLKAGGVGLNLLPGKRVFLMDKWWNKSVEKQAADRVHRIGQTSEVEVYEFQLRGTIEKEVSRIQKKKDGNETNFFHEDSRRCLSIKDIHSVFNTMKTRQNKIKMITEQNKL
jgi:DNA repair protein RAD5